MIFLRCVDLTQDVSLGLGLFFRKGGEARRGLKVDGRLSSEAGAQVDPTERNY